MRGGKESRGGKAWQGRARDGKSPLTLPRGVIVPDDKRPLIYEAWGQRRQRPVSWLCFEGSKGTRISGQLVSEWEVVYSKVDGGPVEVKWTHWG